MAFLPFPPHGTRTEPSALSLYRTAVEETGLAQPVAHQKAWIKVRVIE